MRARKTIREAELCCLLLLFLFLPHLAVALVYLARFVFTSASSSPWQEINYQTDGGTDVCHRCLGIAIDADG